MNAVVVEKRDGMAAVLTDRGVVALTPDAGYQIGQRVAVRAKGTLRRRAACMGAAAAVLAVCVTGGVQYATPCAYVTLDVNPSLLLCLNRFDIVLEARALNADADFVVRELYDGGMTARGADAVVRRALRALEGAGYFADEDAAVTLTAASPDEERAERLAASLQQVARQTQNVSVDAGVASVEDTLRRIDEGVSPDETFRTPDAQVSPTPAPDLTPDNTPVASVAPVETPVPTARASKKQEKGDNRRNSATRGNSGKEKKENPGKGKNKG